jgi:SAM-dependent methyltransferase
MADQVGSLAYMRDEYAAYTAKYRDRIKESDRQILQLASQLVKSDGAGCTIVDVGCHTGNLLHHLRKQHPKAKLIGWDIFPPIVERCRADPALSGIEFDVVSVLDIKAEAVADVAILSAVLGRFNDQEHELAWRGIWKALKPGGHAVVFDWYHGFRQTVRIIDETDLHPEGLILTFRSSLAMEDQLKKLGFDHIEFHPFRISVDLANKNAADAVNTHTRRAADGERLQFRGSIFQPWCHMLARKG